MTPPATTHPHLLVFGSRSTASEIAAVAEALFPGRSIHLVRARIDPVTPEAVLSEDDLEAFLRDHPGEHRYIISMSNRGYRAHWLSLAHTLGLQPESVFHPSAVVAKGAKVGAGCYLAAHAVISNDATVAGHCLINYQAVVGHDACLGEHVVVNPGAAIGGQVQIGNHVLIGANAFIAQGRAVGDGCSIDALTYVDQDLPANAVASCRIGSKAAAPAPDRKSEPAQKNNVGVADRAKILRIINQLRENSSQAPVESIAAQTRLREDLGMDSLTLAEFTVHLEAAFGIDVFAEGLAFTVADIEKRLRCGASTV